MNWPDLTIGFCTYKRPWYAMWAINTIQGMLGYAGRIKFHIADGGSSDEDIQYYKYLLRDREVTVDVQNNLADMCNSCAHWGGQLWMTIMDDYALRYPINITPDVKFLLEHPNVGVIRMNRMAYTGEVRADCVGVDGLHWWVADKDGSRDQYLSSIGVHLYHRRFWDAYGDIPSSPPDHPGIAELNGVARFRARPGPTVAFPMRFGEDWDNHHFEPFWHIGIWRTDEYTKTVGSRL